MSGEQIDLDAKRRAIYEQPHRTTYEQCYHCRDVALCVSVSRSDSMPLCHRCLLEAAAHLARVARSTLADIPAHARAVGRSSDPNDMWEDLRTPGHPIRAIAEKLFPRPAPDGADGDVLVVQDGQLVPGPAVPAARTLDGTVGLVNPVTCADCDADMTGQTHVTAIIVHALGQCRATLRDQRDKARHDLATAIDAYNLINIGKTR